MAKKKSLFEKMRDITGNDNAFYMNEENPYEVKEWIDMNCYALNAVLSDGDIFKGLAKGKRYMFAGPSGTAKSFFQTWIIKNYHASQKNCKIISFESEGATVINMLKEAGLPSEDVLIIPVSTIKEVTTQLTRVIDSIIEAKKSGDDTEYVIVIDSLGMLGTEKEIKDNVEGKDSKDLTKQRDIRALARMTSLKVSLAQIPLITVNHSHTDIMSYGAPQKVSGGEGGIYMSDVILLLGKFADREDEGGKKKQVGVKIKAKVVKSRFMQENKIIEIIISFKKGLFKYSNIIKWAEEFDILKKGTADGEKQKFIMPDGRKIKIADVRNPRMAEEVINEELLKAVGEAVQKNFSFGGDEEDDNLDKKDVKENVEETKTKKEPKSSKKVDGKGIDKNSKS